MKVPGALSVKVPGALSVKVPGVKVLLVPNTHCGSQCERVVLPIASTNARAMWMSHTTYQVAY